MKYKILFISTMTIMLMTNCHRNRNISFVPCQSFDEFCMHEVQAIDLYEPYVWVRHSNDTIEIVRTDNINDTMIYLNKGAYWYSSIRIKYDYTSWSKLMNKICPPPITYGYDCLQVDVYRYHLQDTIIEFFFCDMIPEYVYVYGRQSSKAYSLWPSADSIISGQTTLNNLCAHYLQTNDNYVEYCEYKCTMQNSFIRQLVDATGDTITCDSIQLNALGLYHVPTYQFSIEQECHINSIATNRKMVAHISCTTLETNPYN